jgi:hypothetical protein
VGPTAEVCMEATTEVNAPAENQTPVVQHVASSLHSLSYPKKYEYKRTLYWKARRFLCSRKSNQ